MTEYFFEKAKLKDGDVIIVYEAGKWRKPTCILEKDEIDSLNREWDKK